MATHGRDGRGGLGAGIRAGIRRAFHLAIRRRDLVARDVDDEIRLHLELRAEELVRQGMPRARAAAEARRRFGPIDEARPRLIEAARHREARMAFGERLDLVRHDLTYAARQLRRAPGFTLAVALTLGIGIGANATMFGVVDRLLLRPPAHVADPARVTRLYVARRARRFAVDGTNVLPMVSYPGFVAVRRGTPSLAGVAAFFPAHTDIVGEGDAARAENTVEVTGDFFSVLGVRPALGRLLTPDDDAIPSGSLVAVLGYRYWRSRYGAARDVIGAHVVVEGRRYTIVGVAPEGFTGVDIEPVALWLPMSALASQRLGIGWHADGRMAWVRMVARLRRGATLERAESEATAALRSTAADSNAFDWRAAIVGASVAAAREPTRSPRKTSATVATWLAGVAAVVLLVACANVANLLLARALRRRREIAVRVALGVGRRRLVAQLLTESLTLAALGALAGLAIARWGGAIVRGVLLPDVDWSGAVIDRRVLAFTVAATLLTALLTGLAPAVDVLSRDVVAGLRAGTRDGTTRRSPARTGLLLLQGALSTVLLIGAGLFVRSLHRVSTLHMGYEPDRLLVVEAVMPRETKPEVELAAYDRMLARARQLPGVERAALTTTTPFWSLAAGDLTIPGFDSLAALGPDYPVYNEVSPEWFATMGTRIARGRGFGASDVRGAPRVAIVNEAMARRIWRGVDPIGRCLKVGGDTTPCSQVIGVAETIVQNDVREPPALQYYLPVAQRQTTNTMRALFVRPTDRPDRVAERVRRALAAVVPEARYVRVRPFAELIDPSLRPWRLGATMFGVFGAVALAIAALGLYSVMAYAVAQRAHEMGVRLALGARGADLVRLVLGRGVAIAVAGVATGLVIAAAAGRWIAPLLFDVSAHDAGVFVGVAVTLVSVAVVATLFPALRAARVDPSEALRSD